MRCGCPECGSFMVQSEGESPECVCPECSYRCTACLGTNSVVSKEHLRDLTRDPRFSAERLQGLFDELGRMNDEEDEDVPNPDR